MSDDFSHTRFTGEARAFDRVVFLELEGVLNSERYFANHPGIVEDELEGAENPGDIDHPWLLFDPEAVDSLNRIIESVDPAVVLTSSWRTHYSIETVESYLRKRDYSGSLDASIQEGDQIDPEKHELIMWCEQETDPNEFMVLDTREFRGIQNQRIVDPAVGLTDRDAQAVLEHFGEE